MNTKDGIREELLALHDDGLAVMGLLKQPGGVGFGIAYQSWYSRALPAMASLAPDRHGEFRGYYEADSRRKSLNTGNFVIQDFLKRVLPVAMTDVGAARRAETCMYNQITILHGVANRIDALVANIEGELYSELKDSELAVARRLAKVSLRAAGALAGVVVEGHMQKVADAHGVALQKRNPTIADLIDPLKGAGLIDTPTWRKICYLADIRNLCCHRKSDEPTAEQVDDLIAGAEWLTSNLF